MRSVFKNLYFYIFLVIFFVIFNYFFGGNVFSFSWFGVWNTNENFKMGSDYIKTSIIDDTSVGLTVANVNLGEESYKDKNYYSLTKALELIDNSQKKIGTNIVNILDGKNNKATILEAYLNESQSLLSSLSDIESNLREVYNSKKSESITCNNEKKQGDQTFLKGMRENDKKLLVDGLEKSLDKGPCYLKNRIISNAHKKVLDKVDFYKNVLNKKYDLLLNNKDVIVKNIALFKNSKLDRLTSIRNQLRSFKISNPTQ